MNTSWQPPHCEARSAGRSPGRWRLLATLGSFGLGLLAGQARPLPVPFASEYQAEIWGLAEGFPENSCSGIVTAPDGYLWLSSFRGLMRFNGQVFRHWGPAAMPDLATVSIVNMYRDRSGRVWISTLEGLVCNEGPRWTRWQEDAGWLDRADYVRSYAEAPDGTIVFGRFSGRVLRFESAGFRELPAAPGEGGAQCGFDGDGTLYVVRRGFAGFFRDGQWQEIAGERALRSLAIGAGQDRDGHALLLSPHEVLRVRAGRVTERLALSQPIKHHWQLTVDAQGTLWLPGIDSGVYRIRPDGGVKHFLKADGLPHSGGTRVVHADENGGIWIGGGVGGLTRLRPKRFHYVGETEGLSERVILTLAPLRDGRMLMTSYGGGPTYFDGTRTTQMPPLDDPRIASVRTAVRTHDEAIWLGTFGQGLFRLSAGVLTPMATDILGPTESIHSLFEDAQHRLWVGGERRIAFGRAGVFTEVAFAAEQQRRQPTLFADRPDGAVLIAKYNEIYSYTAGGLQPIPILRLPAECRISTLLHDVRGRLWIGTTNLGLIAFRDGRWWRFPENGGLPGTTISSLVLDNTGHLWFGAGRAIVRTDPDQLWDVIQQRAESAFITVFNAEDGLRDLDLPYGSQPGVAKDDRGRLWFALLRGAAMIDPAALKLNLRPPPVVVESLSYIPPGATQPVELLLTTPADSPVLPPGSRLIRISYAARDFAAPRKQRYRVRLGGAAGRWQDMQDDTTISFAELAPGRHTLQIQASGSDGAWNRTGTTLSFVLSPFYWQTGWFRALLGVGFVGLVTGGAWFAAQRRIRRVRESLEHERRLTEAQVRLALVLENTSDFVGFVDPAGQLLYINRAGRRLVGLAPDADIRLLAAASLLPAWAQEQLTRTALPVALRTGTWSGDSALRHATGSEIPVSQVLIAHHAPNGNLDFTSMIARDISAAKHHAQVQESLRSLATALTASLDSAQLGQAVANAAHALFQHDAFLLVLTGQNGEPATCAYREDTPEGQDRPQAIPAGDFALDGGFRQALGGDPLLINDPPPAAGPAATPVDPTAPGPSSIRGRRSASQVFAPILWNGRTTGVISVQSYTPQRFRPADLELLRTLAAHCGAAIARLEAESSLRRNEERLRQKQKLEAIGTLAGGIAHDFNNILTAILGNAELARLDSPTDGSTREYLEVIHQSGLRARDLVRRIMAFSQPGELRRAPTALLPTVQEVVKLLRATIPANIELRITVPPTVPLVETISTGIHQALLNLGTNAWHALKSQAGRIEFIVDTCTVGVGQPAPDPNLVPGAYVRIVVADSGTGIAPEVLPRIFDPFFTTKGPGEGTGLGLSIVHGIMRASGGTVTVESTLGVGTRFSLYFPVSATSPAPATAPAVPRSAETTRARGEHILYVDDEPTLVSLVKRLLTRAGYVVTGYTDPRDALAAFRQDPASFDLVVTDYSMPEMTGLELAAALLHLRPDLPVLLTSGYRSPGLAEEARQVGVHRVLDKVDSTAELLPLVARMLRERG